MTKQLKILFSFLFPIIIIAGIVFLGWQNSPEPTAEAQSYTIRSGHPRLLITQDDIPLIRCRVGMAGYQDYCSNFGEFASDWAATKSKADLIAGTSQHAGRVLYLLAFVHLVENYPGTPDIYSNHVKNSLVNNLHENSVCDGAIAFDWIYDTLTPDEILTIGNNFMASYFAPVPPDTIPWRAGTLFAQIGVAVGKSLALYGEFTPGSPEDNLVKSVYNSLAVYLPGNFTVGLNQAGALTQESPHYAYNCEYDIPMILEMWQTATGEDVWSGVSESVGRYGDYYMWYSNPAVVQYSGGSGMPTRDDTMDNPNVPFVESIALIAKRGRSSVAQWYANRAQYADASLSNGWRNWRKILWHDSSLAEADIFALPTSKDLGGGYIAMRSGWENDAIVAMFQAGDYFFGHQHVDSGSFQIHYKGRLAIDSGSYIAYQAVSQYGGTSNGHSANYYQRSIAHNVVTIYDPNEIFSRDGYNTGNDGGQRYLPSPGSAPLQEGSRYDTGDLEQVDLTQNYDYLYADLTKAYNAKHYTYPYDKTNNVKREFIYLKPNYFIILDRVNALDPSFTKDWLLHFENRPLVNNADLDPAKLVRGNNQGGMWQYDNADLVTITDGAGRLFVKSLLPQDKLLRIVGGPKTPMTVPSGSYAGRAYVGGTADTYEYWTKPGNKEGGQNAWYQLGSPVQLGSDSFVANGWGRMEIEPTIQQKDDVFLHVLQAADSTTQQMSQVQLTEEGSYYAILINDPALTYNKVLLSKTNTGDYQITSANITPKPQITLTKQADKTSAQPNEELTYTITYQNTGQAEAKNITITDAIPQGASYVQGSAAAGGSYEAGQVLWTIPTLPAGGQGSVSFKVKIE